MIAWAFFYKKLEDLDADEAAWTRLSIGLVANGEALHVLLLR